MAQNMVLSYLHFGILKFPLTTYTAQVDSKRPQDTKLLGLLGSAMIYPHWFYFDLYNTICHGGRFRQLPWTTPSSRRTGPPATAPRCSSRRKVPFSCGDAMLAALKSWVNHGSLIMGKTWLIMGKSWENHRKIMVKGGSTFKSTMFHGKSQEPVGTYMKISLQRFKRHFFLKAMTIRPRWDDWQAI